MRKQQPHAYNTRMAEIHCRHFTGYKPCGFNENCDYNCPQRDIPLTRILVVHLGALGAVLRATSILPSIKRKYPKAHITWLTEKPGHHLLSNNPLIDRVLTTEIMDLMVLNNFKFDVVFCLDKSLEATGILRRVRHEKTFGFKSDSRSGAILPANPEARYLWELGLNNQKKFYENQKPETQLLVEGLALGQFERDPYQVFLTEEEEKVSELRKKLWAPQKEILVGLNTGCAETIPYKKLSIGSQIRLVEMLSHMTHVKVVLLGGPVDSQRNAEIAKKTKAISSPTENGIRDGLVSVNACDIVVSGDSLGMHMAIGLKKWVVAWFGPTCHQEIDLYDRGAKILAPIPCSPCWKRSCHRNPMCYEIVSLEELVLATKKGIQWLRQTSLSKQHSSEMHFSASPSLSN